MNMVSMHRPSAVALLKKNIGKSSLNTILQACKYYQLPYFSGADKKYRFSGQKQTPIVIGSLEDLSFYPVKGQPEDLKSFLKQKDPQKRKENSSEMSRLLFEPLLTAGKPKMEMFFLEKYLLIPTESGRLIFIADDHTHAAFFWAMARTAELVKGAANVLHIDEHWDKNALKHEFLSEGNSFFLANAARYMWEELEICNFMAFAVDQKIVADYGVYYFLTENNGEGRFHETSFWEKHSNMGEVDGYVVSLERLEEVLVRVRQDGKGLFCDIDLDFFHAFFTPKGPTNIIGFSFEEAFEKTIQAAKSSNLITIHTSPSYFLVTDQAEVTMSLLKRMIRALN